MVRYTDTWNILFHVYHGISGFESKLERNNKEYFLKGLLKTCRYKF